MNEDYHESSLRITREALSKLEEELLYYKNDNAYFKYLAHNREMQIDLVMNTVEIAIEELNKQGDDRSKTVLVILNNLMARLLESE